MPVQKAAIAKVVGRRRFRRFVAGVVVTLFGVLVAPFLGVGGVLAVALTAAASVTPEGPSGPACSVEWEDGATVVIPGAGGDGQWTLTEEQKATAIGLYSGAVQANATSFEAALVLGAAMQESTLQVFANELVPESLNHPHHAVATPTTTDGTAVDTLGPLQQRPSAGWGAIADLMNPAYAARAFLGGTGGPNAGSPPGLRDIVSGTLPFADSIEAVQVSGEGEKYAKWEIPAVYLVEQLEAGTVQTCAALSGDIAAPLENWPLVAVTDGVGPRDNSAHGASSWHPAYDFIHTDGETCGRPVFAMMSGTVTVVNGGANAMWVTGADGAAIGYLHMEVYTVGLGDIVQAGQHECGRPCLSREADRRFGQ